MSDGGRPLVHAGACARRRVAVAACLSLAALLAPRAVTAASGASGASGITMAEIRARGTLRWGGDLQGGAPYVSESAVRPGELEGFEVDIASALAKSLGVRAQFVQTDWSTLISALERGSIDIVLNGLEVLPTRRARVRFSRPYFVFVERLSVRSDDPGTRAWTAAATEGTALGFLRGRRVGTLTNSYAWDLLGAAGAARVPFEGQDEPYRDLVSGRIDAVLMDDIIAARYGNKPGLRVVGDFATGQYAVGLRPLDGELAEAIDRALADLIGSGQLRAILRRHGLDGPRQASLGGTTPPHDGPADVRTASTRGLDAQQVKLFFAGAGVTLLISVGAMTVAMLLGLGLALVRLPSHSRMRRWAGRGAAVYIELFRGTPVLLQLYVLYYGLAPVIALPPLLAAVLGLGLNYAAYEAEIYRAGFQSVPRGQIEAAEALGMSGVQVMRRVTLPQALRFSLPGIANDFIALLKDSSLVSVITVVELTKRMTIAAVDGGGWLAPGLLCAAFYLAMSFPLARLLRRLERRLGPHV